MGKQKFAIGGELDLVTSQEHVHATNRVIKAIVASRQPETVEHVTVQIAVDANGNIGGGVGGSGTKLWTCPVGMRARIHRVSVQGAPGVAPPNAPLVAGWWALALDGPFPFEMFWPNPAVAAGVVVPILIEDGSGALQLRNGQGLVAIGAGLTTAENTNLIGRFQIHLREDYPARIGEDK